MPFVFSGQYNKGYLSYQSIKLAWKLINQHLIQISQEPTSYQLSCLPVAPPVCPCVGTPWTNGHPYSNDRTRVSAGPSVVPTDPCCLVLQCFEPKKHMKSNTVKSHLMVTYSKTVFLPKHPWKTSELIHEAEACDAFWVLRLICIKILYLSLSYHY